MKELVENYNSTIREDQTISVVFKNVVVYDISADNPTLAGTAAFQVYHLMNVNGKIIYKDRGFKILSWTREADGWKVFRERWYPQTMEIIPDIELKNKWDFNEQEIDALKGSYFTVRN